MGFVASGLALSMEHPDCCWSKCGGSGAHCNVDSFLLCHSHGNCTEASPAPSPLQVTIPMPAPSTILMSPPSSALALPGTPLRELAKPHGILFGSDVHDTWPDP